MPSNDRIHRLSLDIVRYCCRPVSRIRATALHNRPINRQTCFLTTITIRAYEDDDHDDHDYGDLRVSCSAVVQWQRGKRRTGVRYRILNVPIRWVLYLFWGFFLWEFASMRWLMYTLFIALFIFIGAYVFYSRSIARSFGVSCLPTTPRVQLLARCPESSCSKTW